LTQQHVQEVLQVKCPFLLLASLYGLKCFDCFCDSVVCANRFL
jgi:hypothetical protein